MARRSRYSRELFYLSSDGHIVSVPVRTAPSLDVGIPATLFTTTGRWPWTDFDVTLDGITVILNWSSNIGR